MTFKPGKSGNPAGRPPGTTDLPKEYEGMTHKQIFRSIAINKAIPVILKHIEKESVEASKIALEYGFGKPVQQVHQVSINMDYSSWSDAPREEFSDTGKMPMIASGEREDKAVKDTKPALNDKNKEIK